MKSIKLFSIFTFLILLGLGKNSYGMRREEKVPKEKVIEHKKELPQITFSIYNPNIIISSTPKAIKIWDIKTGKLIKTFVSKAGKIGDKERKEFEKALKQKSEIPPKN